MSPPLESATTARAPVRSALARACGVASLVVLQIGSPTSAHAQSSQADRALALLDRQSCEAAIDAVNDGMRADEPKAHFVAGQMFQYGYCLKQDVPRAMRTYQRGAQLGDRDSARLLAVACARGDGVAQDYAQAARWYAVMRREPGGPAVPPLDAFGTKEIAIDTYVEAVHDLAEQLLAYPRDAVERGVTGSVTVRFDPRVGRVRIVSSTDSIGPNAPEPNRHDFERVLLAGYADAIRLLPRPSMPASVDNTSERQVAFIRRAARTDQPVLLQGLAR